MAAIANAIKITTNQMFSHFIREVVSEDEVAEIVQKRLGRYYYMWGHVDWEILLHVNAWDHLGRNFMASRGCVLPIYSHVNVFVI